MSGAPQPLDPQDPVPETNMPWRRGLAFLVTVAILLLQRDALHRLPADDILDFAFGQQWLLVLIWLLYAGGASAAEITAMLANMQVRLGRLLGRAPPPQP